MRVYFHDDVPFHNTLLFHVVEVLPPLLVERLTATATAFVNRRDIHPASKLS